MVEGEGLQGFSLNIGVIEDIFQHAKPFGHNEKPENSNLGFGFLYYGIARAIRPNHVLVIGSGFGFSVVCLALGMKDNGKGRLTFVDPSYSVLKHGPWNTFGGRGTWDKPEEVAERFRHFGVDEIITHYKLTSEEFFPRFKASGLPKIDIAFVDGNHSYKNIRYDFLGTLRCARRNSYIFLHDSNIYVSAARWHNRPSPPERLVDDQWDRHPFHIPPKSNRPYPKRGIGGSHRASRTAPSADDCNA